MREVTHNEGRMGVRWSTASTEEDEDEEERKRAKKEAERENAFVPDGEDSGVLAGYMQ